MNGSYWKEDSEILLYHLHAAISQVSTCGIYHWSTKPMHVLALRGRPMSIGANLRCQASLDGKLSDPVEPGLTGLVAMALNIFVHVEDSACFTKQ